ncbi:response regulator transcription factor [Paenibacillus sp. NEAU-GSW1]|uniref:response regulator transcription factor n=1 Tax=Paenibacillus sp. NEAU-GSW1 TaxID=2682486 RepID=UPI0012E30DEA|nr:response regulator transcription factor [Paenibacillus sp. NEAU-GSW1]MUT68756.1 response regulator [Paenibacillus sp. NEAU-GSW1]
MKRILLIEDEKHFARFIELELKRESFQIAIAANGLSGLELALRESWDLVLLDLMLPGIDGIEVCKQIREAKEMPIIMITARDSVTDKVSGLDSGADDYIAKPFAIEELLARIRVVFRRQEGHSTAKRTMLVSNGLCVDIEARMVTKNGVEIELTKREYGLLETLLKFTNRVLSRDELLDKVWGYDAAVDKNVVDVYVRYLRNKIDSPDQPSMIETVRGVGYVIRK